MVVQEILSLKQQVPSCQRNFLEPIVIPWMRSLTVRITESGPSSSSDHKLPFLETEKNMLLYSKLEIYKKRMEKFLWLPMSINQIRHDYAMNGNFFLFFGTNLGVAGCFCGRNFSEKDILFHFFQSCSHAQAYSRNHTCHLGKKT